MPDIGIPIEEANRDLEIYAPNGIGNTYKNADLLLLQVRNLSNDPIQFPIDYRIMLFIYEDDQWIQIGNNFEYQCPLRGCDEIIFPPSKNDFFQEGSIEASPYQPGLKKTLPCRLIIIGHKMSNGIITDETSVGYFDFQLKPR